MKQISYERCVLCPNECNINRNEKKGFCLASASANVSSFQPHFWEEPIICNEKGSGAIFFSGCTMRCVYCQNSEISRKPIGNNYSAKELIDIFKELESQDCCNINLISATPYLPTILEALAEYKPRIPLVYNSGGYEKTEILKELQGFIDIYLPDFKYFSDDLALKYSGVASYKCHCQEAIAEMVRQQPKPVFNDKGILQKGVIIRHLILPNNLENSKNFLDWYAVNYKDNTYLSLMSQYLPMNDLSKCPEINRLLKPIEYKILINHALKLNIENCFIQELSSASKDFIPKLR